MKQQFDQPKISAEIANVKQKPQKFILKCSWDWIKNWKVKIVKIPFNEMMRTSIAMRIRFKRIQKKLFHA